VEVSGSLTPHSGFELFSGVTWLRVRAKGDDGVERDRMPYSPNFTLQTGFRLRFLEDFLLSGDYQYLRNVYAVTSARAVNPTAPESNFLELTDAYKLPNINVANFRLDYFFALSKMRIKEGRLFLALNNALDAKYAYALETNEIQSAYYYMPGLTFMLGFEVKF
jgi:iron complex outermembrane receptor protein